MKYFVIESMEKDGSTIINLEKNSGKGMCLCCHKEVPSRLYSLLLFHSSEEKPKKRSTDNSTCLDCLFITGEASDMFAKMQVFDTLKKAKEAYMEKVMLCKL